MNRTSFKMLSARDREAWHAWLAKNHAIMDGIWLVYYKKHTGKPTVSYEDAVEEALCFGWIDSTVRTIDEERYMQLFTPRKAGSNWSDLNKRRVKRLIEQGLMTEAGLRKIEEAKKDGSWRNLDAVEKLKIPPDFQQVLTANKDAQKKFENLPASRRKAFLYWIGSAKREATRKKRIVASVKLLAENRMPGV